MEIDLFHCNRYILRRLLNKLVNREGQEMETPLTSRRRVDIEKQQENLNTHAEKKREEKKVTMKDN